MRAFDVMATAIAVARPEMTVSDAAKMMIDYQISGLPVVDKSGELVGMITEGDLLRRAEIGTDTKPRAWWLDLIASKRERASDYVKTHSRLVSEVMTTSNIVTASEDMTLAEIAELLERHHIKRVPVLRDGKLTGLVSRANLVRALASAAPDSRESVRDDPTLRDAVLAALQSTRWALPRENVLVSNGVVHLWGVITCEEEDKAIRVAVENVPGVKGVNSHLGYPLVPLL